MKKYIVTGLFLICLINANAQYKTGILIAQNFSSFRFISSDNEVSNPGYTVKFGYGFEIQREYSKNVFAEALLSYNNTGAISNADLARLEWSFQYLNVAVEAGYRFGSGRIRPISGAGLYYGRLIKADQFIGSSYYDLMSGKIVKKNDFGPVIFAGMEYKYSNKFLENGVIFARVNGSLGLLNLEDYKAVKQKMFNRVLSIQAGILFSFRL